MLRLFFASFLVIALQLLYAVPDLAAETKPKGAHFENLDSAFVAPDEKKVYFSKQQQIYVSEKLPSGSWSHAHRLIRGCCPMSVSSGRKIFTNAIEPERGKSSGILYRERRSSGWLGEKFIKALNSPFDDVDPHADDTVQTLVFSSNRPGGRGGFDLYFAKRRGPNWPRLDNLGALVNTNAEERHPWLSRDGRRVYFSRNGQILWTEKVKGAWIQAQSLS